MKSDIQIAHEAELRPIGEIAAKLGVNDCEQYGKYKAKIDPVVSSKGGKLILVTAINPTALGERAASSSWSPRSIRPRSARARRPRR